MLKKIKSRGQNNTEMKEKEASGHSSVSLAKSLNTDALFKAVAGKLVNYSCVKIKNGANLSNLKHSDIAMIKK